MFRTLPLDHFLFFGLAPRFVQWDFVSLDHLSDIFLLLVLGLHSEGQSAAATSAALPRCETKCKAVVKKRQGKNQ